MEGSAGKINQSLQQALDSAGNVTALNASLLEKMQEIAASTPVVSEQLSAAIAKLQAQNQENQTLLNSLSTANTSIKNALDTTSQTRQDISSLTQQSIDGLHSFRTTLDENLLPQLNATLDTFSSLTGELTGILNGVPATSEQLRGILTQRTERYKRCPFYRFRPAWNCADGSECHYQFGYFPDAPFSGRNEC